LGGSAIGLVHEGNLRKGGGKRGEPLRDMPTIGQETLKGTQFYGLLRLGQGTGMMRL